ncbi:MAG: rhodanese-like domain-containing protein [Bacteroidia bacterium]
MEDITVQELKERKDKNENLHIIDVREPYEYEEYNFGAELVPLATLESKLEEMEDLKDQELIVHCKSGARSAAAKVFMTQKGFTKVRSLIGGAMAYQELELK